jgi:apyrase
MCDKMLCAFRALASGIISDKDAKQATVTPGDFISTASKACALPAAEVERNFPAASQEDASFLCLDLSFQGTLLTEGMKIPKDQPITLVRQVQYNGQFYEAAWPLGAAINTLHSLPEA